MYLTLGYMLEFLDKTQDTCFQGVYWLLGTETLNYKSVFFFFFFLE